MRIKSRIWLIMVFLIVLCAVVWVGTVQTKHDEDTVAVNAAGNLKTQSIEKETQPTTQIQTAPTTEPVESAFTEKAIEKLEKDVDKRLKKNKFSGTILITVGDETVFHKALGYSDIKKETKNQLDTKYEIGSITKQFTAVAITKLAEEKKLSLSDKVTKYFPDFKAGKKVTIENLLRMESGIPDYLNFNIGEVEQGERAEDSTYTQKEFLKWLNKQKLGFNPGEYYYYSNTNYYLLGLIIEQVTGGTYEDYMVNSLLQPNYLYNTTMKMTDTTAQGYLDADGTNGIKIDSSYFYSAGEIVSTTADMWRWVKAFDEGQLISQQSTDKALSQSKSGNNYGYGWFLCGDYYYHTGNTELFYSIALVEKEEDIKIIALSNVNDVTVQEMGKNILDIVRKDLYPEKYATQAKTEKTTKAD